MWEAAIHEVGHAWNYQLCLLARISSIKGAQDTVGDVAEYLGWNIDKSNLRSARTMLGKVISKYSCKDWDEAFAEIFRIAYKDEVTLSEGESAARAACRYAIQQYNTRIIVRLWETQKSRKI